MGWRRLASAVGSVGVLGVALVACGSEPADEASGDPSIETVEPDVPISDELLAVGDVLLAPRHFSSSDDGDAVFASTDAGVSWEPVELPDAPAGLDMDLPGVRLVGDLAVVTGRAPTESNGMDVPGGDAYVWTSDDGLDWQGGRIAGGGPAFSGVSVAEVDDLLLAAVMTGPTSVVSDEPGTFTVLRSDDGGAAWSPVELPELGLEPQENLNVQAAWEVDGDRLVVKLGGRSRPESVDVSASSGTSQSEGSGGGPVEVEVEGGGSDTSPVDVGDDAVGVDNQPEEPKVDVLVSTDGGETWESGSCEDETLHQHGVCGEVEDYGGLLVHGDEVSVDGGETWQEPVIEPEPEHSTPALTGAVELPRGGWLAAGYNTEAGDVSFGYLLRSSDGVHWEQLLGPEPCDTGRPNSRVHVPTRLADGWLVAYNCVDLNWPEFSRLYVVDADGGDLREMEGATGKFAYGQPEVVGDTAVFTRWDEDNNVTVVQVSP